MPRAMTEAERQALEDRLMEFVRSSTTATPPCIPSRVNCITSAPRRIRCILTRNDPLLPMVRRWIREGVKSDAME